MMTRFDLAAFSLAFVFGSISAPAWAQGVERIDPVSQTYKIGDVGHISKLGIEVEVTLQKATPQISASRASVSGFLVQALYRDPLGQQGETLSLLHPTIFPASCRPGMQSKEYGPFSRRNRRSTQFSLYLIQRCKDTGLGVAAPYLEARIFCSDVAKEQRYLEAVATNHIFDITPTGYTENVETVAGHVIKGAEAAYDLYSEAQSLISDVEVVLDVLSVVNGTLAVGAFIVQTVEQLVESKLKGVVISGAFDYVYSEVGTRAEFKITGYDVTCRICGHHFHLQAIADGDRIRCPSGDGEAIIHFH